MPLYRPVDVHPSFDIIDATKDIEFTFRIKGDDCCTGYLIDIYDSSGKKVTSYYDSGSGTFGTFDDPIIDTFDIPLYNNDIVKRIIPAGTLPELKNGKSYRWKLMLKGDSPIYNKTIFSGYLSHVIINYKHAWLLRKASLIDVVKPGMKLQLTERWFESIISRVRLYGTTELVIYTADTPSFSTGPFLATITSPYYEISPMYTFDAYKDPSITDITVTGNSPENSFIATCSHSTSVPHLKYYWEIYQDGEKIFETDYLTRPYTKSGGTTTFKCDYNGLIKEDAVYKAKIVVEDKRNRIATCEKEYTVSLDQIIQEDTAVAQEMISEDGKSLGCINIDWSNMSEEISSNNVVILKTEGDSGIFRVIATVNGVTSLNDYDVEPNKTYRYKVCICDTPRLVCETNRVEYKFNKWMVAELQQYDDSFVVAEDSVWFFEGNCEPHDTNLNIDYSIYNNLSFTPKISQGNNKYLTSGLTCYLGDVSCGGTYFEEFDMIKKWREFCARNTLKLVKTPKGDNLICKIHDVSDKFNYNQSGFPTTISFSFTEVIKNKLPIIGQVT